MAGWDGYLARILLVKIVSISVSSQRGTLLGVVEIHIVSQFKTNDDFVLQE